MGWFARGWGWRTRGTAALPATVSIPSSGVTFTGGDVTVPSLVVSAGGFVTIPPGTAAAPSFRFTGFTTTGLAAPSGLMSPIVSGVARATWGSINSSVSAMTFASYIGSSEIAAPGAGAANTWRMYAVDLAGKTQLNVIFGTGAAQQLALEI